MDKIIHGLIIITGLIGFVASIATLVFSGIPTINAFIIMLFCIILIFYNRISELALKIGDWSFDAKMQRLEDVTDKAMQVAKALGALQHFQIISSGRWGGGETLFEMYSRAESLLADLRAFGVEISDIEMMRKSVNIYVKKRLLQLDWKFS